MKKTIGIVMLLLVLLVTAPAYARSPISKEQCFDANGLNGNYYISFVLSGFSGKAIEDGYVVSSVSLSDFPPGMSFNLCGTLQASATTDSFFGEVYDSLNNLAYLKSEGTIIWDAYTTKAYLVGGYDNGTTSGYIDGTIKCSRGKCTLTAKGGISDYSSFIVSYTSIKGSGIPELKK
jgi:hypothetical protein